jgi:AcrR family transcriptional regulator
VSRPTAQKRPRRRTQAERTAATRAKLLDATIECLVELGYEATTGRVVAERAGVSRGAETHHYPRRVDLIVGAVDEIASRRIAQALRQMEELPRGRARVRGALDLLWSIFMSPLSLAATKLFVAANDDPELQARMVQNEHEVSRAFVTGLREALGSGEGKRDKALEQRLDVAISAVRGLAFTVTFDIPDRSIDDLWAYHRRELEAMLLR